MKPHLLHILQHSLGVDQYGQGKQYRSHFVTGPGSNDFDQCQELCVSGLMHDHGVQSMMSGMHYFSVTEEGRKAMSAASPAAPKTKRKSPAFQSWQNYCDACQWIPFGEFLKTVWKEEGIYQ